MIHICPTVPEPITAASATTTFVVRILKDAALAYRTACYCDGWRRGQCIHACAITHFNYLLRYRGTFTAVWILAKTVEDWDWTCRSAKPEAYSTLGAQNRKSEKNKEFGTHLHSFTAFVRRSQDVKCGLIDSMLYSCR